MGGLPRIEEIIITINCDDTLSSIRMDRVFIKEVLSNLLNNAIQRAPEAGRVEVGAQNNGKLCFRVFDNGRELASGYHEKVFDKFEQATM
jgi:signal transduction histidine kinase